MTSLSDYLITRAQKVSDAHLHLPTIEATMVTGSAVKGLADTYSDIDMTFYYADSLPSDDELEQIRLQLTDSAELKWTIGSREQGSFAQAYIWDGIEVQCGHTTIQTWQATMDHVLLEFTADTSAQKALEGTLNCLPLHGARVIRAWQERIENYPDGLGEAMVEHYLRFFPVWGLQHHFATRDATVWLYQSLVELAHNLVGVLAGINKLYFTTFQFKRMGRFIDQMTHKPANFYQRLDGLFSADFATVSAESESLVKETIEIVNQQMPSIDTTAAASRLGWRHKPWQITPHAN